MNLIIMRMVNVWKEFTLFSVSVCICAIIAVNPVTAQKFYKTTVAEDYQNAKNLFGQHKIEEARAAWYDIYKNRAYQLSPAQKTALTRCIQQCNLLLKQQKEANTTNIERASAEIVKATPLLRASLPLDIAEKEDYLKSAIAWLEKATPKEKTTFEYNLFNAHCYIHIDEPEKAFPFIEKALELNSQSTKALNMKAHYQFIHGKLDECLRTAKSSIEIDTNDNSTAWYWMVKALIEKGDKDSFHLAWKNMKRAIANDERIAKEFSFIVPTPRHRKWLENHAREIATAKAKLEKDQMRTSGPSVNAVKGGE